MLRKESSHEGKTVRRLSERAGWGLQERQGCEHRGSREEENRKRPKEMPRVKATFTNSLRTPDVAHVTSSLL